MRSIVLNGTLAATPAHPTGDITLADLNDFMSVFLYTVHSQGYEFHGHLTLDEGEDPDED